MTQQRRLNRILELLADRGQLEIEDISSEFDVSAATARRDLNTLAKERLITRTHGGAVAFSSAYELPLQYKIVQNAEAKTAIARVAAGLVAPGQVVGLTGGTTTTEIARELARADHLHSLQGEQTLTIVTNALNIAYEMAIRPHVKILTTGGVARPQTFELVGPLAVASVTSLTMDWAFIGVNGLHEKFGATTVDEGEAEINRILAAGARRGVAVADHSKMSEATFARICGLADLAGIVTDTEPPRAMRDAARASGVEIYLPGAHELH